MTLREAIKLLTDYQQWRLGNDDFPMQIPSEITKALDILLNHSISTLELPQQEISDEEMENAAPVGNLTKEQGFIEGAKWYREQLKNRQ